MDIEREVATLKRLTVAQLHMRYGEVFGEQPRSRHRVWLIRRIAWRIQAAKEGGISERARRRALELANEADLRVTAPRGLSVKTEAAHTRGSEPSSDQRLPMAGTQLTRQYKGRTVVVNVLSDGFEFEGRVLPSLSAVAKAVTGSHWNGFHFFGLSKQRTRS